MSSARRPLRSPLSSSAPVPARVRARARGVALAGLLLAAGCGPAPEREEAPPAPGRAAELRIGTGDRAATIRRDDFGVPHVYAAHMKGVWFGAGYAQAEDRLVQLELVRRNVEGTLSELFGPSQLDHDRSIRTFFYTREEIAAQLAGLSPAHQEELREFSAGVNAYVAAAYATAASRQAMVPYEFFVLGQLAGLPGPYRPADWEPVDTVALGIFMARSFGGGGGNELEYQGFLDYLKAERRSKGVRDPDREARAIFNDALWLNDPTAPTTVPSRRGGRGADGRPEERPQGASATAAALTDRGDPAPGAGELAADDDSDDGAPPAEDDLLPLATLDPAAPRAAPPADATAAAARALAGHRALLRRAGEELKVPWRDGSNAFVVAPWRSRSGNALLLGGPQEGFGTPSVNGEQYLHGPGYDAFGMYLTGEPYVLIGANRELAWTTTSEELVEEQVYVEKVDFTTTPPRYLFRGRYRPMTTVRHSIPVAGAAPEELIVYRTVHGPVFHADPARGLAFTMRFASFHREIGTLVGFGELAAARDLDDFRDATSRIATLHNLFYADRRGNIAYFGAGLLPILPRCRTCDPRLPHNGDGSEEWLGFEPFSRMPRSVNPAQGYLVNWNSKPDQRHFYQQNVRDEYWGTIYRSDRIAELLRHERRADLHTLTDIARDIGTMDGDDTLRPAAPYFLPHLLRAYEDLRRRRDPLADPGAHPLLPRAVAELRAWDRHSSLGSPAMSIFVQFMEALLRNSFGGGARPGAAYVGAVNFNDGSLGAGTHLGRATYNLLYHLLAGTRGVVPCDGKCLARDYFAGHREHLLVESLNDAIALLSGTGPLWGNGDARGFGTPDVGRWGWRPSADINWDELNPLAAGVTTRLGRSPSQQRSTYLQALELGRVVRGVNVVPPGQSGFIDAAGRPSPHFADQLGLFDAFRYQPMAPRR